MGDIKKVPNFLTSIHSSKTIIFQQELVFTLKKKISKTKFSDERKLLKYEVFEN